MKKILIAVAITLACPTFIFAQVSPDINFLFGGALSEAGGGAATSSQTADLSQGSGSINIYSTLGFDFDIGDLDFFSSNTNVVQFTGGVGFNPASVIGNRFDSSVVTVDPGGASSNLFAVAVLGLGINSSFANFDPLFDSTVGTGFAGANGSFLLARVDYDIVGVGTTEFSFGLGDLGFPRDLPQQIPLYPTFGDATLTVVPEPSSAIVLMLCSVGLAVRRRRV